MLDERKIKLLTQHNLCEETLKQIEDYDEDKEIVTFKDGSKHQLVECFTRVMGYYRPVSQFNNGKQSEFNDRKWFEEKAIKEPVIAVVEGGTCGCKEEN